MRGILLAFLLLAGPAFAQIGGQQYGPSPCPMGASGCQVKAADGTTPLSLANWFWGLAKSGAFWTFHPATTTATDSPNINTLRTTTHTGGTPGFVDFNFRAYTAVGANVANFEWGLASVLDNSATAGENVAGYFQANKYTTGPTWGLVSECNDKNNTPSSVSGAMPCVEIDIGSGGLDDATAVGIRGGIDMVAHRDGGATGTAEIGWGARVGVAANTTIRRGFYIAGEFNQAAFDTSLGTAGSRSAVTAAAFRSAKDQLWDFSGDSSYFFKLNSGGDVLQWYHGATALFSLNNVGSLSVATDIRSIDAAMTPTAGIYGYNVIGATGAGGLDTSTATLTGSAVRMASGQTIALNAAADKTLQYDGTLLNYKNGSTSEFSVSDAGNVIMAGSVQPVSVKWAAGNLSFFQHTNNAEIVRFTDTGQNLGSYFNFAYTAGGNVLSITPGGGAANMTVGGSGGGGVFLNSSSAGLAVNSSGHITAAGTVPVVTAGATDCGTSPSIAGNDNVGRVTVGTSTNGAKCTLTFASSWGTAPVCSVFDETTAVALRPAPTTTALVINGAIVASDKVVYNCEGF